MKFDVWNLMAGGAALGLLASFWNYIKAFLWKVANLLVQQVEIPSEEAHDAVVAYLVRHMKRSRLYDRMYGAQYEHSRDGRYGLVPYEFFGNRTMVFWNRCFPFLFSKSRRTGPRRASRAPTPSKRAGPRSIRRSPTCAARSTSRRCCARRATAATGWPGRSPPSRRRPATASSSTTCPTAEARTRSGAVGPTGWP